MIIGYHFNCHFNSPIFLTPRDHDFYIEPGGMTRSLQMTHFKTNLIDHKPMYRAFKNYFKMIFKYGILMLEKSIIIDQK